LGSAAPKNEKPGFEGGEAGLAAGTFFGAGGEKNEKDGLGADFAGAGEGAGALGAGGEKNENDGAAFLAGDRAGGGDVAVGVGFGAAWGKNENDGAAAFLLAAGAGAGDTCFTFTSFFFEPKNDAKASVTGSETSISGVGLPEEVGCVAFGSCLEEVGDERKGIVSVLAGLASFFAAGFFA
jgi:hypothetical protein